MPVAKLLLKKILQRMGYQIKRSPRAESAAQAELHLDPFYDQALLLGANKVQLILDVGAFVGGIAQEYRQHFPTAKIISFEPFPDSFNKCRERSAALQPMDVHQLAVADKNGQQTMHCLSFSAMNSLLNFDMASTVVPADSMADIEKPKEAGDIVVKVTSIDDFCRAQKLSHIDILKMDVQGGEFAALQGTRAMLETKSIDLVYLEISFAELYKKTPLFFEIYSMLHGYGFVLFDLYNVVKAKNNMELAYGEAVFIRKELLPSAGGVATA